MNDKGVMGIIASSEGVEPIMNRNYKNDDVLVEGSVDKYLPEKITKTVDKIAELSLKVKEAEDAAIVAKQRASEASSQRTGWFRNTKAIESIQDGLSSLSKAQSVAMEAQRVSFEFQKQLAETTQYLFGLGITNIAMNRTVVRELELKLKGASKEKLSKLAQQELLGVIAQLKAQEDIMSKTEKNTNIIKEHHEDICRIKDDVDGMEKNIDDVEENIDDIEDNIDEIEEDIDDIEKNIDEVEEDIDDIEKNIDEVEEDIDDIEKNIDEVEEDIDNIEKNIDEVEINVEDNKKRINELEQELNLLKSKSKKRSFNSNKINASKNTIIKVLLLLVSAMIGLVNCVGLFAIGKKINSKLLISSSIILPIIGVFFIMLTGSDAEQYPMLDMISAFAFIIAFLMPSVLIITNLKNYIYADALINQMIIYGIDLDFLDESDVIEQMPISWVTPQVKQVAKKLFKDKYYIVLFEIDKNINKV